MFAHLLKKKNHNNKISIFPRRFQLENIMSKCFKKKVPLETLQPPFSIIEEQNYKWMRMLWYLPMYYLTPLI